MRIKFKLTAIYTSKRWGNRWKTNLKKTGINILARANEKNLNWMVSLDVFQWRSNFFIFIFIEFST